MEVRDRLQAYVDGELTPEERAEFERLADPELRQEAAELSALAHVLRAESPTYPVAGLEETITALRRPLTVEPVRRAVPWYRRLLAPAFATAVTVALAVVTLQQMSSPGRMAPQTTREERKEVASASAPASPNAFKRNETKALVSPPLYGQPGLGPTTAPNERRVRPPGAGERPLLALRDTAPGIAAPPRQITGRPLRGGDFSLPNTPLPVPIEVTPLPGVAGAAPADTAAEAAAAPTPAGQNPEFAVRRLLASAGARITGVGRTGGNVRFTAAVAGGAVDGLASRLRAVPGARVSVAKSAAARRANPDELTKEDLERQLADLLARKEELLRDFYEDAKPVKEVDAQIAETQRRIANYGRASGDGPATITVTVPARS